MGAIFGVNVIASTTKNLIKWKLNNKINLIGTSLKNSVDYTITNWKSPFVLAMGNEQKGLSDELSGACDQLVKIPMKGKSDSLNLAVSTGMKFFMSQLGIFLINLLTFPSCKNCCANLSRVLLFFSNT